MTNKYLRGSIYWVDMTPYYEINPVISYKKRACIIVTNSKISLHSPSVQVLPCTTQADGKPFHPYVKIDGVDAYVLTDQMMTVNKTELYGYTGVLTPMEMDKVDKSLNEQLGLCQPDNSDVTSKLDTIIGMLDNADILRMKFK